MSQNKGSTRENCVFYLLNTPSHYNATFKIASQLKDWGYHPVYIGNGNMKSMVELNGFEFFEYSIRLFCMDPSKKINRLIGEEKVTFQDLKNYRSNFIKGDYFKPIIERYHPIIVFLDVSKIGFFPELVHKNIKFAILATKVNLNKTPHIPPISSGFIPYKNNLLAGIRCELDWFKVLLQKKINNSINKIQNGGFSLYDLPFEYLKANKLSNYKKYINTYRVANFGLTKIPEFILSPRELDYPDRKIEQNQVYLGPTVYFNRFEVTDNEVKKFIQRKNLVLCSMGSYDSKYQGIRLEFLKKVIQAFKENPEYNVLISLGNDININTKNQLPSNILLSQNVPQLKVLKSCAAMICHGGMQSITESIVNNVPLIVYPLNPKLDQPGNAARVKFHNIGLIGKIHKVTPDNIINKVKQVILDRHIKKCTNDLHQKFIKGKNFNNGMRVLKEYIEAKT